MIPRNGRCQPGDAQIPLTTLALMPLGAEGEMVCPGIICPAMVLFVHTGVCLHHTHTQRILPLSPRALAAQTHTGKLHGDVNPKHLRP